MHSRQEDVVVTSGRREALIVFAAFLIALTYTVGYSTTYGYHRTQENLTYVLGFPDWVFWGIVVPWLASVGFAFFFGAFFMRDEDLGEELDGAGDDGLGLGG